MLKKSKVVALLVVCVMMFAAVEPVFAWWGEDTAYGTAVGGATGGFWGAVIGAVAAGAAVIATGGLAAIPLAGAAIGGAALTGATYGAVSGAATGAVVGAVSDKETVNKTAIINFWCCGCCDRRCWGFAICRGCGYRDCYCRSRV